MRRRTVPLRRRAVVLMLGCVASVLAGCAPAERAVSDDLAKYELPGYAREPLFASVRDWRQLARPTQTMRDHFESEQSMYRVISAARDRVTLVVWKTDTPFGQPFGGDDTGTGHACVTLRRTSGVPAAESAVHAEVVSCPAHLGPRPPLYQTSWGRDSNAVAAAAGGVSAVDSAVIAFLAPRPDRRRSPHIRAELLAAIGRTQLPDGGWLTVALPARQPPGRSRVTGSVDATGPDAIDPRRTATSRACFVVTVPSSGTVPTSVTTTVPCR